MNRNIRKRFISIILTLAMVVSILPAMTLIASAASPAATTVGVSENMGTSVTLNGEINANGEATAVTFEYGKTTGYGTSVTASPSSVSGTGATWVSYLLSGLVPNTTYHYRVVGANAGGTTYGSDQTFTTMAVAPTVTNFLITGITATGATLSGTVNANNTLAAVGFLYGMTTSYGGNISASPYTVSGTTGITVSGSLSGLTPNTTYYVLASATNTGGTTAGGPASFTTLPAAPSNYPVTINIFKDGALAAAPGTVELKQAGATIYTAASSTIGLYSTAAINGVYDLFINNIDTGKDISIINASSSASVNYFTVNYSVSNVGTASGSTISATANGTAIPSGAVVLSGSAIAINAAGAGASTYTYLWSGSGTSEQTTANLSTASLNSAMNAACLVTGTTTSSHGSSSGSSKKDITQAVSTAAEVLNGQTVKDMEEKEAVLEIKSGSVTYTLPASEINIDEVSKQIGEAVELKDIKINVNITEPSANIVKIIEATAIKNNYRIVVAPIEFEIICTSGSKAVDVSQFNGYVERTVAIPDGIAQDKITTGVVLNADGTFSHVPTSITEINGKYFAKINSLTNSTYSVIYNPVEFADAASHWAKDSINNMGARLVVTGDDEGNYNPDKEVTRAEFATIIVRALGLKAGSGENTFADVNDADWYCGYTETAVSYGIISGYDAVTFGPNDKITREQAMTMIARAMKLTGLETSLTEEDGTISPKSYITRAEVAVIVERLLKNSKLI